MVNLTVIKKFVYNIFTMDMIVKVLKEYKKKEPKTKTSKIVISVPKELKNTVVVEINYV